MREYAFQPLCVTFEPGFSSICRRIALMVPGMTWKRSVRLFVTAASSRIAAPAIETRRKRRARSDEAIIGAMAARSSETSPPTSWSSTLTDRAPSDAPSRSAK